MGKIRSGHEFPADFGFTGSAGRIMVQPHERRMASGGRVPNVAKVPQVPKVPSVGALGMAASSVRSKLPKLAGPSMPNYAMRARIPGGKAKGGQVKGK